MDRLEDPALKELVERLEKDADCWDYTTDGVSCASAILERQAAQAIRQLCAENEGLRALIRECRLADGHGARTGDETRWDRAFHALCQAEKPRALSQPKEPR